MVWVGLLKGKAFFIAPLRRDMQVLDDVRIEQLGQRTDLVLSLCKLGLCLLLSAVWLVLGVYLLTYLLFQCLILPMACLRNLQLQSACVRLPFDWVRKCRIALQMVWIGNFLLVNLCLETNFAVLDSVDKFCVVFGRDGVSSLSLLIFLMTSIWSLTLNFWRRIKLIF